MSILSIVVCSVVVNEDFLFCGENRFGIFWGGMKYLLLNNKIVILFCFFLPMIGCGGREAWHHVVTLSLVVGVEALCEVVALHMIYPIEILKRHKTHTRIISQFRKRERKKHKNIFKK